MATFEIDGKEYELKLTYKSVKRLNSLYEGGSYELLGMVFQGDIELFINVIHCALFHTEENFSLKKIEEEVAKMIDSQELSQEDMVRIKDEVVAKSFFYGKSLEKMLKMDPQMKDMVEKLRA